MSRFDRYDELREEAQQQCKIGGDPSKAIAFALLAVAEAIVVTEDPGDRQITGTLAVDS